MSNEQGKKKFTRRQLIGSTLAATRKVAEKAEATWVPLQESFDKAVNDAPAAYWAGDGVHPSMAGHMRMTMTWLRALRN